uniref:Putative tail protein n=1 Tax=viral metagenome TaxID=1070528 RepID=A0A6M3KHL7_9ZZZZ
MSYDLTATFHSETKKIDNITPLDMVIVNASYSGEEYYYYVNNNQNVIGYILNASGNLGATETTYTALPVDIGAFQTNITGETPSVSITVPNVDRVVESLIQTKNYLRGCAAYHLRCFAKHLPSGATAYHVGTSPDIHAVIKEKLYIDTTASNENVVTFTCKPKFAIKYAMIPRRTYSRECAWAFTDRYRLTNCDPGASINAASYPLCDGTLKNCRERHNEQRFGGFPAIPSEAIIII